MVQVWEDVEYVTTFKEEATNTKKQKREFSTEETLRGKPKPKQAKASESGTARSTEGLEPEPANTFKIDPKQEKRS